jgi:glycerophosphoryl diester phosphodiesterase
MAVKALLVLTSLLFPAAKARGDEPFQVHGHRGARAVLPENSLPAFEHALQAGVDYIETDVRLTRDDQMVLHHDPVVSRDLCRGPEGRPIEGEPPAIRRLTLDELRAFDCGSRPHPEFPRQERRPGTRIPTLDELFSLIESSPHPAARTVGVHIELKTRPRKDVPPAEELAERVVAVVRKHGMLDRVIFQSFSPSYTKAANELADRLGRRRKVPVISPEFTWLRGLKGKALLRVLKAQGLLVVPWTANARDDWAWLIELGVDGIITDDPAGLIQYLGERGLRP